MPMARRAGLSSSIHPRTQLNPDPRLGRQCTPLRRPPDRSHQAARLGSL